MIRSNILPEKRLSWTRVWPQPKNKKVNLIHVYNFMIQFIAPYKYSEVYMLPTCSRLTTNDTRKWANANSPGVTPATHVRSSRPSLRSMMMIIAEYPRAIECTIVKMIPEYDKERDNLCDVVITTCRTFREYRKFIGIYNSFGYLEPWNL